MGEELFSCDAWLVAEDGLAVVVGECEVPEGAFDGEGGGYCGHGIRILKQNLQNSQNLQNCCPLFCWAGCWVKLRRIFGKWKWGDLAGCSFFEPRRARRDAEGVGGT